MAVQIQLRRDTAANWTSENSILAEGEVGFETDTGEAKIGDGSTAWNSLDYFGGGGTAADIAFTPNGSIAASDVQSAIQEVRDEAQPLDADLTAIAGLSPSNDDVIQRKAGSWINRTLTQLISDLAALGTTFQPLDADLTAIAALSSAANKLPYATGVGTWALTDFTAAGRALVDDADAAAQRTTLSVQGYSRTTFSNAAVSVAATDVLVEQIGTMSASRTATLPAASAVPAGWEIIIGDASGTVTSTNTIVIARAGSDTINGATSVTIASPYGHRRIISDGVSTWTYDGGVLRASSNLSDVASASTARTNLGVGTGDSPQFTAIELNNTDTTLARSSAGNVTIEGNLIYRAGGTDVPVTDGGTGASTAGAAATNLGLGTGDAVTHASLTLTGAASVAGGLILGDAYQPGSISATQDNWNPGNQHISKYIVVDCGAGSATLRGINTTNMTAGHTFWLRASNTAGGTLTITHASANSTSGYRFSCPGSANYTLSALEWVQVAYLPGISAANTLALITPA